METTKQVGICILCVYRYIIINHYLNIAQISQCIRRTWVEYYTVLLCAHLKSPLISTGSVALQKRDLHLFGYLHTKHSCLMSAAQECDTNDL